MLCGQRMRVNGDMMIRCERLMVPRRRGVKSLRVSGEDKEPISMMGGIGKELVKLMTGIGLNREKKRV